MDPQFGFKPCDRHFVSRTIGQGSGHNVQRQATGTALGLIEGIVIACEDEMDLGAPIGDVNLAAIDQPIISISFGRRPRPL